MNRRDKIKKIILDDLGGSFIGSQKTFEIVVDIICDKLKDVEDDYNELLSAYIRL